MAGSLYRVIVRIAKVVLALCIILATLGGLGWYVLEQMSWSHTVVRHRAKMEDCRPRDTLEVQLAGRTLTLEAGPMISAHTGALQGISTINARPMRNPYSQKAMATETYVFCARANTPQQMPVTSVSFYSQGGKPLVEAVRLPVHYPYHLWIGEAGLEFIQRPDATDTWARGQGAYLFPTPRYDKQFAAGPATNSGLRIDAWCYMSGPTPVDTRNCVIAVRDLAWGLNYGADQARVAWDNAADAPDPDALEEIAEKLRAIVEILESGDGIR